MLTGPDIVVYGVAIDLIFGVWVLFATSSYIFLLYYSSSEPGRAHFCSMINQKDCGYLIL